MTMSPIWRMATSREEEEEVDPMPTVATTKMPVVSDRYIRVSCLFGRIDHSQHFFLAALEVAAFSSRLPHDKMTSEESQLFPDIIYQN